LIGRNVGTADKHHRPTVIARFPNELPRSLQIMR
jgi:hypothetical protein